MFILEHRTNVIPYDLNIYNVNIRGKRGNIVQVYPAVEYDFVPKRLNITSKDAVSLQWTGNNFEQPNCIKTKRLLSYNDGTFESALLLLQHIFVLMSLF